MCSKMLLKILKCEIGGYVKKIWGVEKNGYILKLCGLCGSTHARPALNPHGLWVMQGGAKRASELK